MDVAGFSNGVGSSVAATRDHLQAVLSLPFDLVRENYAMAVKVGLIERSMLASAKFGRTLTHMEAIALGPLARRR